MVVISLGPFPYRGWMMFTTPSSHLQKIQMNQRIHSCRSSRFRFHFCHSSRFHFHFCRSFHFHSYHSFHCFPMRAQVHTIRRYPIHGPIRESDHIHTRRGSIQPKACLQRTTFQTSPKTYQICLTSPWIPFQIFQWSPYRTFRMRKNHCNRRRRHRHHHRHKKVVGDLCSRFLHFLAPFRLTIVVGFVPRFLDFPNQWSFQLS
mmetsp:Transcript_27353/g.56583  ORF Transcript_27353/g.56583 Transcript_27353/m.56583 type:complete len:203 (-) Transcript_27353:2736-3344(-)